MGESPHGSMIWEWGLQLGVRLGAGSGSGSASSDHKSHLRNRQKVDQRANQLVAWTVGGRGRQRWRRRSWSKIKNRAYVTSSHTSPSGVARKHVLLMPHSFLLLEPSKVLPPSLSPLALWLSASSQSSGSTRSRASRESSSMHRLLPTISNASACCTHVSRVV